MTQVLAIPSEIEIEGIASGDPNDYILDKELLDENCNVIAK